MANTESGSVPSASVPRQISRQDYWQTLIEECRQSGLRQAEFCRQRGIKRRRLSFWKWKLSRPPGTKAPAASGRGRPPRPRAFVPVRVVTARQRSGEGTNAAPAWDGEIEFALVTGRVVRVRGRVDLDWLRQVLVSVESTRC